MAPSRRLLAGALFVLAASSCASLRFERTSETSGTFASTAVAFTFLSYDVPGPALSIARGNAADSGQSELVVEREVVYPYLWRLDWILDIVSVRYARVVGTWGTPAEE